MYARTVGRKPNPLKLDKDDLAEVGVTPWSLHVPKVDEVIFRDPKVSDKDDFKEKTAIARQVYIKPSGFPEFGHTRGCPKCEHELSYGPGRTSRPHSQRCRARIMGELAMSAAGPRRIAAAAERLDRTVVEMGQQHRSDISQGANADVGLVRRDSQAPSVLQPPVDSRPFENRAAPPEDRVHIGQHQEDDVH